MGFIRHLTPSSIKAFLRKVEFHLLLISAILQVTVRDSGSVLNRRILTKLRRAWANMDWPATVECLEKMAWLVSRTQGPILECGSGLSTIILGLLVRKQGAEIWSLEHSPEWHARVNRMLRLYSFKNSKLCLTPLRNYEDFTWYSTPPERFPKDFRLVICDGPPGSTPGGRYGLLPVMGDYLAPDCVILFDDAARGGETDTLRQWEEEFGVKVNMLGAERTFAIITLS